MSTTRKVFSYKPGLLAILLLFVLSSPAQLRQIFYDHDEPDNELHKMSFYSASEGYIGFRDWVGYTVDSGRTFTRKYIKFNNVDYGNNSVNLTFGFGIKGVKAFNKNALIAYGEYGLVPAILYSNNGGTTWKLVYHSQYNPAELSTGIMDMAFPEDNATGFAIDADRVLKTTNGGQAWSVVHIRPHAFFTNISAVNNTVLFIYSRHYDTNKLIKSSNGGTIWSTLTIPAGKIRSAYFLTASIGWMTTYADNGNAEYVYKTTNGGQAWTVQNDPFITPFSGLQLKFFDENLGFALSGQNTVVRTVDGGKIWEPLPRDNDFTYLGYSHNDLHFWNSTQFWAGGGHGLLEITNNGGGISFPKAYFKIDTTGVARTGNVTLLNYSRTGYQYKWYVNNVFAGSTYNISYKHVVSSPRDSITLIVSNGTHADTIKKHQLFYVPPFPVLTSFFPASGSTGTAVTINGEDLNGTTGVSFGGVAAFSYQIVSNNKIIAVVGTGASGSIGLNSAYGNFTTPGFTYIPPPVSKPPSISSFTPASGYLGTTVTISGSNFEPLAANNLVYFGSAKATVLTASPTQITCTVPAGASFQPISVLSTTTKLTGHAARPFHITFADGGGNFTRNSFKHMVSFSYVPEGGHPDHVAGTDLDGDGKPELLVAVNYYGRDSIGIYHNSSTTSNISFGPKFSLDRIYGFGYATFATGDLDGDGRKEIVANTGGGSLSAYLNTSVPGNISFLPPMQLPPVQNSNEIYIEDFDNDGRNDIIAGGYNASQLSVLRNTSSPGKLSFASKVAIAGGHKLNLAVGDLDGDGKRDFAMLSGGSGGSFDTFKYYRNTSSVGHISFVLESEFALSSGALQSGDIRLADYDGDNKLDVIILMDRFIHILRNTSTTGTISFADIITYPVTDIGQGFTIDNLNGDAKPDLLRGSWGYRQYWLYKNVSTPQNITTDPALSVEGPYPFNLIPYSTNTADFNLDGKADMILSGSNDKMISVYRNTIGDPIMFPTCETANTRLNSDIPGTTFQWQVDEGSGYINISDNELYSGTKTITLNIKNTPLALNNFKYRCLVNEQLYSSYFVLQVDPRIIPEIKISTENTSVCGGTVVKFTAQVTNPGYGTIFRWQKNGEPVGNNSDTYSTTLLKNNDQVRVVYYSNGDCGINDVVTSNVITMTVSGGIPSVTIATPDNIICDSGTITFTATPVNPGMATYQWQINGVNAGDNSTSFTPEAPKNGDVVKLIMTASGYCISSTPVSSNTISISVRPTVTPLVSITANSSIICPGSPIVFTATTVNGGTSPHYQWKVNGANFGSSQRTYTSSNLSAGDEVWLEMTSNAACLTTSTAVSNKIIISAATTPVVPAVSISTTQTSICMGTTAQFEATPTNGGTSPIYQWKVNEINVGTNSPVFSSNTLPDNAQVKVVMKSNAACANPSSVTSNVISMKVTISSPATMSIAGVTAVNAGQSSRITSVVVNGGTNPAYQWQDSTSTYTWRDIAGGASAGIDYKPRQTGDKLRCRLSSSGSCIADPVVYSNTLTFAVSPVTAINTVPASSLGIRIYPNPVTSIFTIDSLRVNENWLSLDIMSMDGKHKLLTKMTGHQSRLTVDVSHLPAGYYLVLLKRKSGKTAYLKFVKL